MNEVSWETLKNLQQSFGVPFKTYVDSANNRTVLIVESGAIFFTNLINSSDKEEFETYYLEESNKSNTAINEHSRSIEVMQRLVPRGYYLYITNAYYTLGNGFHGNEYWNASSLDTSNTDAHKIHFDFAIPNGYYLEGVYFAFYSEVIPENTWIKEVCLCPNIPQYKTVLGDSKKFLKKETEIKVEALGAPKYVKDVKDTNISIGTHVLRFYLEHKSTDTGVLEIGARTYKQ